MSVISPARKLIVAAMKTRPLTVAQASTIGKCGTKRARDLLARMVRDGQARSDRTSDAAKYFLLDVPVQVAARSIDRPRQKTYEHYPLHHVRDELVAYLFGAPKQHGEMTK